MFMHARTQSPTKQYGKVAHEIGVGWDCETSPATLDFFQPVLHAVGPDDIPRVSYFQSRWTADCRRGECTAGSQAGEVPGELWEGIKAVFGDESKVRRVVPYAADGGVGDVSGI